MYYFLNPKNLSSVFTVPCSVSDKYLKLCTETQLKVLIYFLRNLSNTPSAKDIAEFLSLPESEALDALNFWTSVGILMSDSNKAQTAPEKPTAVVRAEKPSRNDVARRGLEDKKIMFLLREAQLKFGRNLKTNETSTLVWLYDDIGMDISLILMAIQFAINEGRPNISYIEKTAIAWANKGIETVLEAEAEIAEIARRKTAWGIVEAAFGIEKRQPSEKELTLSFKWVNEWGFSREILKAAYDACIDSKSKISMPYIDKILESWHKDNIKNVSDIAEKQSKKSQKVNNNSNSTTYDINLFEEMLNRD